MSLHYRRYQRHQTERRTWDKMSDARLEDLDTYMVKHPWLGQASALIRLREYRLARPSRTYRTGRTQL